MATKSSSGNKDAGWRQIYVIAGWAAIISAILYVGDIIVITTQGPLFETAGQFFSAFQSDRLAGILQLFLTDLYGTLLFIPIAIALYATLKDTNFGYAALATVGGLIGVTATLATNMGYTMIAIGEKYATAIEAQGAGLLAVADSLISASFHGTSFLVAGFLFEGALLIFSLLMLRNSSFSRLLT